MPAADGARREQKVDRRQRRAAAATVRRIDVGFGPPGLAVEAAFGMWRQVEIADELRDARVYGVPPLPISRSSAATCSSKVFRFSATKFR